MFVLISSILSIILHALAIGFFILVFVLLYSLYASARDLSKTMESYRPEARDDSGNLKRR